MESLDDIPLNRYMVDPENLWMHSADKRQDLIEEVAKKTVEMFVDMSFQNHEDCIYTDKANLYSRCLLSRGLFYVEYSDAIREGDGERALRCW